MYRRMYLSSIHHIWLEPLILKTILPNRNFQIESDLVMYVLKGGLSEKSDVILTLDSLFYYVN